jgi:Cellulose synthase
MIGGTSAHLVAVFQGILKVIAGIEISFTLTSKAATEDEEDEFSDLYVIKWTFLMIPPITIMMVNIMIDGEERKNTDNCFYLVGTYLDHDCSACCWHQPAVKQQVADWRLILVPLRRCC